MTGSYIGRVTKTFKDKVTGDVKILNYLRLLVGDDIVDVYLSDGFRDDSYKVMDDITIDVDVRARDNKLLFRSLS